MFQTINHLPPFSVGVLMQKKVTKADFKCVLIPALKKIAKEWKAINLLLVLDTGFSHFTLGAWLQDFSINFKYFWKWNKIAVVCKSRVLRKLLVFFNFVMPGEVKMFASKDIVKATAWVSKP